MIIRMNLLENRQRLLFWLLAVLSVASLLLFLGSSLFNTKGEPREAIVALSMLQSGDWVSPVNNGVDIAYKPPFFHWCIALCSLLMGRVTEFTARFPSAFATIVMLLSSYCYMLKNKVDPRLAFLTGLITMTTFEVHRAAMACRVDMMLSAFIVIALYTFHRWYVGRNLWLVPLTVLLLSGAFLTKGPVGALLPCMVMGVYMFVRRENFFRAFFCCMVFFLASCLLPLCWYYLAYLERGDRFLYLVYEENVLRFTGKMVYSSHEGPAIYNVQTLLTGFLPYTLLLLFSLFAFRYRRLRLTVGVSGWLKKCWSRVSNLSDQDLLALLSAVIVFVFYCIPKSKRSVYLLPVYPFLSYYLARFMLWITGNRRSMANVYGWVLSVIALLLPVLTFVTRMGLVPHGIFHGKHASENLAYLSGLEHLSLSFPLVLALVFTFVGILVFVRSRKTGGGYRLCSSFAVIVIAINMMLDGVILPHIFDVKTDYYVAQELRSLVPDGCKIWDYRSDWKPGDRNRMHQFSINFYLDDRIVPLDENKPRSGYMIMGDDDVATFRDSCPSYVLTRVKRFSHRSCDDKRYLTLYKFVNR